MKRNLWVVPLLMLLVLATAGCAARASTPYPETVVVGGVSQSEAPYSGAPVADVRYQSGSSATDISAERMVVRTGELDLIVPDTQQALEQIGQMAEELGGYVVSLNTYQYQEGLQATIVLRIPNEHFDEALQRLRDAATTVRHESRAGQDVTAQYVDLESRLRHLRAKEAQLLEFLDQAEDTEAVLAVYEQLSATQAEIEQVVGQMRYLEDQTTLSTITVNLTPDALAQPLETGGWNLPGTVRDAVERLLDFLEFFVKALIYTVLLVLPALILLALPVVGLVFLLRWLIRRSRARKQA